MIVFESKYSLLAILLLWSFGVACAQNYGRHGKHFPGQQIARSILINIRLLFIIHCRTVLEWSAELQCQHLREHKLAKYTRSHTGNGAGR